MMRIAPMPDYAAQRLNMVESQVRANDVTDIRIHAAMRDIPRERFVPTAKRAVAYADGAVEVVANRYLLEPRTFAKSVQLAQIAPTDKVLDVGCLTGYSTAVIARLAAKVIGLEQDADLVRVASDMVPAVGATNISIVQGSLAEGHRAGAPYDAIFINGAIEAEPEALLSQLAEGGRLVAVVQSGEQSRANLYLRQNGRIGSRIAFDAWTPLLAGFRQKVGFVF
jgi:protein-L-isoaspartate(D-aspartate) O-methyltransferase